MSTTHFIHWLAGCGLSSAPIVLALSLTSPAPAAEVVGYDQVKEILRKRCVTCHNPDELRGDLDLKELTAILAGSASGDVVVAGDPSASLLYTTIAHLEDPAMPPNSAPIPAREQDLIRRWTGRTHVGPKSRGDLPVGLSDCTSNCLRRI